MGYRLSDDQYLLAQKCVKVRNDEAIRLNKKDRYGLKGDPLTTHLKGLLGEIAAYYLLGVAWEHRHGEWKKGRPDLGLNTEVRTGLYIIRQSDTWPTHLDRNMVCVHTSEHLEVETPYKQAIKTWRDVEYDLPGWIKIRDGINVGRICCPDPTRPPCWIVAEKHLRPISELINL